MPVSDLPPLPTVIGQLSHRPAIPFSLNELYILLAPFLPSPSTTGSPPPPSTWETVYAYYGEGSQATYFTLDEGSWAVIFAFPDAGGLVKIASAYSDPTTSFSSREPLFRDIMVYLKTTYSGQMISFGGVQDGLQATFDEFVEGEKGVPGRSYKVQKLLSKSLDPEASAKVLDETKFEKSSLRWDEVAEALQLFGSSYTPDHFEKLVHFTSCIRDLSTPERKPVSWCLVYADLSIAALHTVTGYRGASLAHHTVTHLASLLLAAFSFLPPDLRLAYPGQEATNDNGELWMVADFNHGNPAGEGFFTSQGFERLEEAVRWSKGRM